jgi:hypothetical protein
MNVLKLQNMALKVINVIYEIQKIQNQLILLSAVEMSIHWCNKNVNIKIYVKMAKTWYLFINSLKTKKQALWF